MVDGYGDCWRMAAIGVSVGLDRGYAYLLEKPGDRWCSIQESDMMTVP